MNIICRLVFASTLSLFLGAGCPPGDQPSKPASAGKEKTARDFPQQNQNEREQEVEKQAEQSPQDLKREQPARPEHDHEAFSQRLAEREAMVAGQIVSRPFAEPVRDPNVLQAMRTVPRHAFVPSEYQDLAYADRPLPIGYSQTISQPYIVAYMTEMLRLDPKAKVLEIGTGSGYQAAVAAELAEQVYSIEIIKELGHSASWRLKELGYKNVEVKVGDGYYGWPEKGPFDAVIVTAASSHVPPSLIDQLKPGGRLIIPLGSAWQAQELVLLSKNQDGSVQSQGLMPVRFVPMLGKAQE